MKRTNSISNWLTLMLLFFVLNVQAQENSKIETVKNSIDEIIEDIHHAADTIEHIDQINWIYEVGSYAKLNNLIDYFDDLGGPEEQVAKYKVHSRVLEDRLLTRKKNLDIGNVIDLEYQAEVEADILDLRAQLKKADSEELHFIQRDFELLQKIFDLNMRHNTVVGEWKEITREELLQLKQEIDEKSDDLSK